MNKSAEKIFAKIEAKVESIRRRTANLNADQLRVKLAVTELNYEDALDQRDYLMSSDWKPVIREFQTELGEAIRLSHRLDYTSARRVQEILSRLIGMLGDRLGEKVA